MPPAIVWTINAAWIAVLALWFLAAARTKRSVRIESRASRLTQLAFMAATFILLFRNDLRWGGLSRRFVPASLSIALSGLALTLAGLAFAVWARAFLGRNWSARVTLKRDHELIRSGPYAIVRHPIYAGFLLALIGTALVVGEVRALLAVACALAGWQIKVRTEEAFMMEQFGAEYADYKRRVKALIPFVL